MKTKAYIITAAILLAISVQSCSSDKSNKPEKQAKTAEELPKVEIKQVFTQNVPQTAEYTATVQAFKTNNIASSTPNRIKSILVDIGAKVSRGQRLVILDDVNIDQLKVRIDNAEREYKRALKLLEIGGGTQQSVDQLKTELDAQRRQYTNMVENTVLISPITGVVTARNYDPGDMTGSLPILTIEQVNPVKVIINVSESDYPLIRKGMKVDIRSDVYGDETFTGTVYLIHPTVDASTRTFTVEITIDNADGRILPGMFARVCINYGQTDRVVVPDRAVVKMSGSGNKYVYIYNPQTQTVSYNRVELGARIADTYEIINGVPDGSYVITAGQTRLADGAKVEVLDKNRPKEK